MDFMRVESSDVNISNSEARVKERLFNSTFALLLRSRQYTLTHLICQLLKIRLSKKLAKPRNTQTNTLPTPFNKIMMIAQMASRKREIGFPAPGKFSLISSLLAPKSKSSSVLKNPITGCGIKARK